MYLVTQLFGIRMYFYLDYAFLTERLISAVHYLQHVLWDKLPKSSLNKFKSHKSWCFMVSKNVAFTYNRIWEEEFSLTRLFICDLNLTLEMICRNVTLYNDFFNTDGEYFIRATSRENLSYSVRARSKTQISCVA